MLDVMGNTPSAELLNRSLLDHIKCLLACGGARVIVYSNGGQEEDEMDGQDNEAEHEEENGTPKSPPIDIPRCQEALRLCGSRSSISSM